MSADPHPFSSASTAGRVLIVVGETYRTTSGRGLLVTKVTDHSVKYIVDGVELKADRRTFVAAIRGSGG